MSRSAPAPISVPSPTAVPRSQILPAIPEPPPAASRGDGPASVAASPHHRRLRPSAAPPPLLLLFASRSSGPSRKMDGFIAHVIQRRHNHDSFRFRVILQEDRADLFTRFGIDDVPTVLVVHGQRVAARMDGLHPPPVVEDLLAPWLRR